MREDLAQQNNKDAGSVSYRSFRESMQAEDPLRGRQQKRRHDRDDRDEDITWRKYSSEQ